MDPLFTLPTQATPPFGRATNFELKKVLLETPLNTSVQTGRHVFSFQNTSSEWWVPSKSYLRLRLAYERLDATGSPEGGLPPCLEDMIAPVMNPCAHLFQRIEYYLDGNRVSDLQDHIAQIDTLKFRTSRSTSHLDSFGETSNWMQPEFKVRQHRIASGRRAGAFPLLANDKKIPIVAGTINLATHDARQQLGALHVGKGAAGTLFQADRLQFEAESMQPKLIWDAHNFPNDISLSFPRHEAPEAANDVKRDTAVQAIPVLVAAANLVKDHYLLMFEPRQFDGTTQGFTRLIYNARTDIVGQPPAAQIALEAKEETNLGIEAHAGYVNLSTALGASVADLTAWVGGSLIFKNLKVGSILTGSGALGRTSASCTAAITDIYYGPERSSSLTAVDVTVTPGAVAANNTALGATTVVAGAALANEIKEVFNNPRVRDNNTPVASAVVPMGLVLHIPGLTMTSTNSVPDEMQTTTPRVFRSVSRRVRLQYLFGGLTADTDILNPTTCTLTLSVVLKTPPELSTNRAPTAVSNQFECCWLPPLGIFSVGHAMPPTRHRLEFTVANDFQLRMIEFGDLQPWETSDASSRIANPGQTGIDVAHKFRVRIVDMSFFAAMVTGPRSDDVQFTLEFAERKMIQYQIPQNQMATPTAYNFNISPTSTDVTVAFQSTFAGRGIQSLSKFHVPTRARTFGCETALKRFYVNFNGQNRPREENESILIKPFPSTGLIDAPVEQKKLNMSGAVLLLNDNTGNDEAKAPLADQVLTRLPTRARGIDTKQFFTQRYVESMLNTSMMFSSGGCESFHTWLERGAYYHWVWPRDGADLSTTFMVFLEFYPVESKIDDRFLLDQKDESNQAYHQSIGKDNVPNTVNLCIFDKSMRSFTLTIQNGNVTYAETSNSFTADGVRRPRVG